MFKRLDSRPPVKVEVPVLETVKFVKVVVPKLADEVARMEGVRIPP